jgi:thymidylate synthase
MNLPTVADIRDEFMALKAAEHFVTDKTGVKMIELIGVSFLADADAIFGTVNWDYVNREIDWYGSQSLRVADIPGGPPKIWQQVASRDGEINSNYGWAILSEENGDQYQKCLEQLLNFPESRRAVMIYTRPSMQTDYNRDGMSDFMCTNVVQYLIRNGKLHAIVQMRSNDVVFGYKNDRAWQKIVLDRLVSDYNSRYFHAGRAHEIQAGSIIWNAGSLHVYSRHFDLIK